MKRFDDQRTINDKHGKKQNKKEMNQKKKNDRRTTNEYHTHHGRVELMTTQPWLGVPSLSAMVPPSSIITNLCGGRRERLPNKSVIANYQ